METNNAFNVPVLLIAFNRPEHTQIVFDAVRKQKPKYLFVFQDGAREGNVSDQEKCAAVQAILSETLDWVCEIKTFFSKVNLGCGKGPTAGITWFFDHVEQGIILEDDSIPHPDFFPYCKTLLELYKNNAEVKVIGSANFQNKKRGDGSYYFSMQNGCFCSWATWKRTWDEYDYYLKKISTNNFKKSLNDYNISLKEYIYWIDIYYQVKKDRYNESCWDYQLMFNIWRNRGVGIVPNANLATNIGFNEFATHTYNENHPGANRPSESILPLIHPKDLKLNRKADLFYHNFYYQPPQKGNKRLLLKVIIINKYIKSLFNINKSWKNHFISVSKIVLSWLANKKSEIKSTLHWNKKGRLLKSIILNYYGTLEKNKISIDELKVVSYLERNKMSLLPYYFKKKYRKKDVNVLWDKKTGLNYVLVDDKKLYYRKDWKKNKIKSYHSYLLAEQDYESPHCYLTEDFSLRTDAVFVDVGAAEGILALMNIDKVSQVFLIEPDPLWIEALYATFSPWKTKSEIINKYASSHNSDKTISIDSFFVNQRVDFIKIDVEGWEREVLKGCKNVLSLNYPLKVVIATYHRQNDENEFMQLLNEKRFRGKFSQGFVPYFYQTNFEKPYLRKCLIRAEKRTKY